MKKFNKGDKYYVINIKSKDKIENLKLINSHGQLNNVTRGIDYDYVDEYEWYKNTRDYDIEIVRYVVERNGENVIDEYPIRVVFYYISADTPHENNTTATFKDDLNSTKTTSQSTSQPASQPASKSTSQPASKSTSQPSSQPSSQPTSKSTSQPTSQPASKSTPANRDTNDMISADSDNTSISKTDNLTTSKNNICMANEFYAYQNTNYNFNLYDTQTIKNIIESYKIESIKSLLLPKEESIFSTIKILYFDTTLELQAFLNDYYIFLPNLRVIHPSHTYEDFKLPVIHFFIKPFKSISKESLKESTSFVSGGLSNLGNTCFMNSALQCLSSLKLFNEYFQEKYKNDGNKVDTGEGDKRECTRRCGEVDNTRKQVAPQGCKSEDAISNRAISPEEKQVDPQECKSEDARSNRAKKQVDPQECNLELKEAPEHKLDIEYSTKKQADPQECKLGLDHKDTVTIKRELVKTYIRPKIMSDEFSALLNKMSKKSIFCPNRFRQVFIQKVKQFNNYHQHDSAEFIETFLDLLQEELRNDTNSIDLTKYHQRMASNNQSLHASIVQESSAEEISAKETSAEETSAKESSLMQTSAKEKSAEEISAKESCLMQTSAKESGAEEIIAKESSLMQTSSEESGAEESGIEQSSVVSFVSAAKGIDSIITKLFHGQFVSTLQCLECNFESFSYETFIILTLPIPENVAMHNFIILTIKNKPPFKIYYANNLSIQKLKLKIQEDFKIKEIAIFNENYKKVKNEQNFIFSYKKLFCYEYESNKTYQFMFLKIKGRFKIFEKVLDYAILCEDLKSKEEIKSKAEWVIAMFGCSNKYDTRDEGLVSDCCALDWIKTDDDYPERSMKDSQEFYSMKDVFSNNECISNNGDTCGKGCKSGSDIHAGIITDTPSCTPSVAGSCTPSDTSSRMYKNSNKSWNAIKNMFKKSENEKISNDFYEIKNVKNIIEKNEDFQVLFDEKNYNRIFGKNFCIEKFLDTKNDTKNITLNSCLELFLKKEYLLNENSVFCKKCTKNTNQSKKMEINILQKYLIIQLKRFRFKGDKINDFIDFDEELKIGRVSYKLRAICNHINTSSDSGHYTAYVKHTKWFCYNDSVVYELDDLKKDNAYILFYEMV